VTLENIDQVLETYPRLLEPLNETLP
jgi:hypothetical protein